MSNSVGLAEGMELTPKKLLISNQSDLRLFVPNYDSFSRKRQNDAELTSHVSPKISSRHA